MADKPIPAEPKPDDSEDAKKAAYLAKLDAFVKAGKARSRTHAEFLLRCEVLK